MIKIIESDRLGNLKIEFPNGTCVRTVYADIVDLSVQLHRLLEKEIRKQIEDGRMKKEGG